MMTQEEAMVALATFGDKNAAQRMARIVKATGRVPMWIENEIRFEKVSAPRLEGNTSGNAAICEDRNYHGGYVE